MIIRIRIQAIFARLTKCAGVSRATALRGELAGSYRIRTGAYPVVFTPSADGNSVKVWKIGHRGGVYE